MGGQKLKHALDETVFQSWVTPEHVLPVLEPKKCGRELSSLRTSFTVSCVARRGVRTVRLQLSSKLGCHSSKIIPEG